MGSGLGKTRPDTRLVRSLSACCRLRAFMTFFGEFHKAVEGFHGDLSVCCQLIFPLVSLRVEAEMRTHGSQRRDAIKPFKETGLAFLSRASKCIRILTSGVVT